MTWPVREAGTLVAMDLLEITAFRWFLVIGAAVLPLLVRALDG